jgi:signal transduction histidine kinase
LFVGFCAYSALLYTGIILRPGAVRRLHLIVLVLDLIFICLLVRYTGGLSSSFTLAFYLLVALHAFYSGMLIGVAAAITSAVFYLAASQPLPDGIYWGDIGLRIAFLFVIAVAVGALSHLERKRLLEIAQLNKEVFARERLLERSYHLAALGRMAGGAAHEINNPAGIIAMRAECLLEEAENGHLSENVVKDLEVIAKHTYRISAVVRSLLTFARKTPFERRPLDLKALVEEAVLLIDHTLVEHGIEVKVVFSSGAGRVLGDPSGLTQVFHHLLQNAVDAMPDGGTVRVEGAYAASNDTFEIRVSDTGMGITAEDQPFIFDPFFTTKPIGEGMGLGLSVCHGIVADHGGRIETVSKTGAGTTFIITFPLAIGPTQTRR